jgi:hypothetical protein
MTPHIVRNPGDMERLKQAEFARVSWCEADIFAMHGDVFPRTGLMQEWQDEDDSVPVIYPDMDPRGSLLPSSNSETILERMAGPEYSQIQPVPGSSANTADARRTSDLSGELPAPVVVNPQQTNPAPRPKSSAGLLRLPRTIKPTPN